MSCILVYYRPDDLINSDESTFIMNFTNGFSDFLGIVCALMMLWLLIVDLKIVQVENEMLDDQIVKDRFGIMFATLQTQNRHALSYNVT